eukprot:2432908-Rhodomonas_salina.1
MHSYHTLLCSHTISSYDSHIRHTLFRIYALATRCPVLPYALSRMAVPGGHPSRAPRCEARDRSHHALPRGRC